jgi:hypothetical protein
MRFFGFLDRLRTRRESLEELMNNVVRKDGEEWVNADLIRARIVVLCQAELDLQRSMPDRRAPADQPAGRPSNWTNEDRAALSSFMKQLRARSTRRAPVRSNGHA